MERNAKWRRKGATSYSEASYHRQKRDALRKVSPTASLTTKLKLRLHQNDEEVSPRYVTRNIAPTFELTFHNGARHTLFIMRALT